MIVFCPISEMTFPFLPFSSFNASIVCFKLLILSLPMNKSKLRWTIVCVCVCVLLIRNKFANLAVNFVETAGVECWMLKYNNNTLQESTLWNISNSSTFLSMPLSTTTRWWSRTIGGKYNIIYASFVDILIFNAKIMNDVNLIKTGSTLNVTFAWNVWNVVVP